MPSDTEAFSLAYRYERRRAGEMRVEQGSFISQQEINIIDLGLIAPDGAQVGVSGADKNEIYIRETDATPGYRPWPLVSGEWQILIGAYKIAVAGVTVTYELSFTPKRRRWLKGDLHTHTLASDGVLTAEELARHAQRHGLDYLAITDHNQMVAANELPRLPGITLIPGLEWTHYQGHANFLGVGSPYDEPFYTNTQEEMQARFATAHARGALITINHPCDPGLEFRFNLDTLPFDCIEIWNGPMRQSNLRAVGLWHNLLRSGKKIAISGGSDYHRDQPFQYLGGPTTCVYASSPGPADILSALKQGHAYIVYAPDGPTLEMTAGDAIPGDSVPFSQVQEVHITAGNLRAGDVLQVVTAQGSASLLQAETDGEAQVRYSMQATGFVRVEILRNSCLACRSCRH